jgi:hypothetical protein
MLNKDEVAAYAGNGRAERGAEMALYQAGT